MPAFSFQGSAMVGILAFLGLGAVVLLGAAAAALFALRGRRRTASRIVAAVTVAVLGYVATLALFAAGSRERVLGTGQEKYFCELDCHLAYSVVGVRRARSLAYPAGEERAGGLYHVVTLRTRFDPETISARRPRGMPLVPNPRVVAVSDRGRRFLPSPEGQEALRRAGEDSVPLERPLRPGESYLTQIVFDLPVDAQAPRLVLTEAFWPTRLLIGHENSPGHRKTSFAL